MKVLDWNYRGASKPSCFNHAKLLVHSYRLDIYCFLETRPSKVSLSKISRVLGSFWQVYTISALGMSRVIIIGWHKNLGSIDFIYTDRWIAFFFGLLSLHDFGPYVLAILYTNTLGITSRIIWDQVLPL